VLNSVTLVGGGARVFSHDQNGNMTQGDGESITYNAFNKPLTISGGGNSTDFTYGADLMRYKQITPSGSTILYLDKLMEIESSGSAVDFRHYLGDVAILTKTGSLNDPSPGIKYTFRDRLGGVSMIADSSGIATEYRGYDAFGKPRNGNWTNKSPATINSSVTDRGFTDHEHLDDWQLIHMNGRGYDYNLGRFLSVDPFIQDPGNSQSINPYTYIMNNPLSGTDPTGYLPRSLFACAQDAGLCRMYGADGDFYDENRGLGSAKPSFEINVGMGFSQKFNGTMDWQSARRLTGVVTVGDIPIDEIENPASSQRVIPQNRAELFESFLSENPEIFTEFMTQREKLRSSINSLERGWYYRGRGADIVTLRDQISALEYQLTCRADICGLEMSTPFLNAFGLTAVVRGGIRVLVPTGGLKWPLNRGFAGTSRSTTLQPGTRIDRYGSEAGAFASPAGTPFGARSLPSEAAAAPLRGYEVVKPLPVQSGRAAPWFGQPGGGIQYELGQSVKSLVDQGFLRRMQ